MKTERIKLDKDQEKRRQAKKRKYEKGGKWNEINMSPRPTNSYLLTGSSTYEAVDEFPDKPNLHSIDSLPLGSDIEEMNLI